MSHSVDTVSGEIYGNKYGLVPTSTFLNIYTRLRVREGWRSIFIWCLLCAGNKASILPCFLSNFKCIREMLGSLHSAHAVCKSGLPLQNPIQPNFSREYIHNIHLYLLATMGVLPTSVNDVVANYCAEAQAEQLIEQVHLCEWVYMYMSCYICM